MPPFIFFLVFFFFLGFLNFILLNQIWEDGGNLGLLTGKELRGICCSAHYDLAGIVSGNSACTQKFANYQFFIFWELFIQPKMSEVFRVY